MGDEQDRTVQAAGPAHRPPRKREPIEVEPSVLVWARTSLGLDPERAAKKVGVAVETLLRWEAGQASPTLPQLRRLAAAYRRPLAVLLLPAPARDFDALRDFRAGSARRVVSPSPELTAEYWRALSQRDVLLEIRDLGGGPSELPKLPGLTLDRSEEHAGLVLRDWLGIPLRLAQPARALSIWLNAAQERGILVVHTRAILQSEMSGFSVSAYPYPVIALNGSDPPRRRLFTLAHEMAHLALNAGGLCDLHQESASKELEDRIELYCNRVAAAALMPLDVLAHMDQFRLAAAEHRWTIQELEVMASSFGISAEAMLLRLITLGRATWDLYRLLKPEFEDAYAAAQEKQKQSSGGPSFYTLKVRDLGSGYVRTVLDAFHNRVISSLDAADYLQIRFEQIARLERATH